MANESIPTIIYLPGLASKHRSTKMFLAAAEQMKRWDFPTKVFTHAYPSHQGPIIQGFEKDLESIEHTINTLEKYGTKRDQIGLVGACYGAYLALRYMQDHQDVPFGILAEPFFGLNSLNFPYKQLTKTIANQSFPFKYLKIPLGEREGQPKSLAAHDFLKFISKEVSFQGKRIPPLLTFVTDYHHFFNRSQIKRTLEEMGSEYCLFTSRASEDERHHTLSHESFAFLGPLYDPRGTVKA
jgi:dienelactone hydrolase